MTRLNVLYQFDEKYAPYAGVSMTSLLESCKDKADVHIYCATMQVSQKNIEKMELLVAAYKQTIIWLDTTKAIEYINSCKTGEWNGSKATWMKIFLIQDLPEEVERILYLDCDTLIVGNIWEIVELDLDQYPIACAYDSLSFQLAKIIGTKVYYNAGVIYYNVKMWKTSGFFEQMLEHLYKNVENYPDNDQRLLNDYFRGHILTLPIKYNLQGIHRLYSEKEYFAAYKEPIYYSNEEIAEAKRNPVVLHFFRILGDYPWEEGNWHPDAPLYETWKAASLWKDEKSLTKSRSLTFRIERVLFRILPKCLFIKIYRKIVDHGAT